MKKIILVLCLTLLILPLVTAECSVPPSRTDYFAYIEECDNQLSLHFNLQPEALNRLKNSVHASCSERNYIISNDGVVENCDIKVVEGTTISGRSVDKYIVYCKGAEIPADVELSGYIDDYDSCGISFPIPQVAKSLKKFSNFITENDYEFNIKESILIDDRGNAYKGKVEYPAGNIKWIGGIIDNDYDSPERYQVEGVEITFLTNKESSIAFIDPDSYFIRERETGLEVYYKKTPTVVAKYHNEKDTLSCTSGYLQDEEGNEIKKLKLAFIGNTETFYCCQAAELFNSDNCIERPQIYEQYYSSLKSAPQCDFLIGGISSLESKELKSKNTGVFYSTDLQEIKSLIS